MTVLCVNSGVTYADIVAADAAEGGTSYGVPTRYEQSGTSTGDVQFIGADYPDSFIYTAATGEESTGVIGVGAKCDGNITTTVTDGAITNLNTGVIHVVSATSAYLRKLVVDAGGGTMDGVSFNDTTDAEDILVHNCNDGFLSSVLVNNSLIKKCTVIGATRFGFAQGKFTDCVDVNSSNQGYFNESVGSSGTWEHDGTGTNTITESPATDIFEDYVGGDYRIKATSSAGAAGAGAFITSAATELSIVGSTPSYSYTVPTAVVDLTGELSIVGSTPSYSYTVPTAVVDLTGELNIVGSTPSYSYTVPTTVVDFTGELSIVGSTPSYSYTVPTAVVDLTGELNIVGSTPSYSYTVPIASVELTGDLVIVATTPTYSYSAIRGSVTFSGGACLDISGEITLNSLQFSGHNKKAHVACFGTISGNVTIDSFNK